MGVSDRFLKLAAALAYLVEGVQFEVHGEREDGERDWGSWGRWHMVRVRWSCECTRRGQKDEPWMNLKWKTAARPPAKLGKAASEWCVTSAIADST